MDKPFPKFNVAAHWMSGSGLFCVQLVEIAENQLQQLLGGTYAIRVVMMDSKGDATVAFTTSGESATELCDLLGKAVDSSRKRTGK